MTKRITIIMLLGLILLLSSCRSNTKEGNIEEVEIPKHETTEEERDEIENLAVSLGVPLIKKTYDSEESIYITSWESANEDKGIYILKHEFRNDYSSWTFFIQFREEYLNLFEGEMDADVVDEDDLLILKTDSAFFGMKKTETSLVILSSKRDIEECAVAFNKLISE